MIKKANKKISINENKFEIKIDGMTCGSCELLLERKLKKITEISKLDVDFKRGSVIIYYTKNRPPLSKINSIIENVGFEISSNKKIKKEISTGRNFMELGGITIILLTLFTFLGNFDLFNNVGITENMSFGFIFLIGVVAAFSSCLAVTAGLLVSITAKYANAHENLTGLQKFKPHIYFNTGRIIGYTLLGGLIGAFGSLFTISSSASGFLTILASLIMVLLGLQLLNLYPKFIKKLMPKLPKSLSHKLMESINQPKPQTPFLLGAGTFFLPCGFTQALQIYVLSLGDPFIGAITMLAFSLGTLPGLLSLGAISSFLRGTAKRYFFKTAGLAVIFLGLFSLQSGLILTEIYIPENTQIVENSNNQNFESLDKNVIIENGTQIVNMEIRGYDYYPSQFTIIKDMPVEWRIDSTGAAGCAQVISMPKLSYTEFLGKSKKTITFTPTQTGNLDFMCSMAMTTPGAKFIVVESETKPISKIYEITLDENIKFRIDVLYTHTGQMKDYYTPEQLTQIKDFDINEYQFDQTSLTSDRKIEILEKVYSQKVSGNYKNKITQLEDKMVEVMYYGITLES
jgi:sulfite exporter TauE/SafE/copper chaperone CopZ